VIPARQAETETYRAARRLKARQERLLWRDLSERTRERIAARMPKATGFWYRETRWHRFVTERGWIRYGRDATHGLPLAVWIVSP
jgi:hypothetical protein